MNGLRAVRRHGADYVADVLDNMGKRNLWKRMLKNTMATTAAGKRTTHIGESDTHYFEKSVFVSYQEPKLLSARLRT